MLPFIDSVNNNEILAVVKDQFTTAEQELFIQSFGQYLSAKSDEFTIDFDNVWRWIGLSRKDNAKTILLTRLEKNVDYKISLLENQERKIHGGQNKETILLTTDGFKNFCLLANTEKAKSVRSYFVKIEKIVFDLITKKYNEYMNSAKEKMEETIKQKVLANEEEQSLHLHNSLIQAFSSPSALVYMGKVRNQGGKLIIKIGITDKGAKERHRGLIKEFVDMRLMHVFEITCNRAMETFLFKHPEIAPLKYGKPTKRYDGISQETFLVTKQELARILEIINQNKIRFKDRASAFHEIELERIKLEQVKLQTLGMYPNVVKKIPVVTEVHQTKLMRQTTKAQSRGPKLQRYCLYGSALLQTYSGYMDAMRDPLFQYVSLSRCGLLEAVRKNCVYKGFRWAELNRDLPDDTIQTLEPTVDSHPVHLGFVAMLNIDKTQVIEVFKDQQSAKIARKLKSTASISQAIRRNSLCSGHYFMLYQDVPELLKREYEANHTLPDCRPRVNSKSVYCLDKTTKNLLKTYASVAAVLKDMAVSRQTLENAVNKGTELCGFLWSFTNKK